MFVPGKIYPIALFSTLFWCKKSSPHNKIIYPKSTSTLFWYTLLSICGVIAYLLTCLGSAGLFSTYLPTGRHLPGGPVQQWARAGGAAEAAAQEAVVADVPPHVPPLHRRPPRRRPQHPPAAHLGHHPQVWMT